MRRDEQIKLAERIKLELESIRAAHPSGLLLPHEVVAFARDPETALHGQFQWDDTKAAHEYRLWQARELIVTVRFRQPEKKPMQFYVSLKTDRQEGGGYRRAEDVLSDADLRKQVVMEALEDMAIYQQRWERLEELAEIWQAAEAVRARLVSR